VGDTDAGRWVDDPPLPEVTPPPEHLIAVRGAQRLRVNNQDHPDPRRRGGHTDTVALAWARAPGGGWAALLAWLGAWQQHGHTTGRGRFGWCRIPEVRVEAMPPDPLPGAAWYGWFEPNELGAAIQAAALTLPGHLREAAVTPRPDDGPDKP
jgi:hypothetical protein